MSSAPEPPSNPGQWARQRKREANARHRAKKKAEKAQEAFAAEMLNAEIGKEWDRRDVLNHEQVALAGMADYQAEVLKVLNISAVVTAMEGEVFFGADVAALTQAISNNGSMESRPNSGKQDSGRSGGTAAGAAPDAAQAQAQPSVGSPPAAAAAAGSGAQRQESGSTAPTSAAGAAPATSTGTGATDTTGAASRADGHESRRRDVPEGRQTPTAVLRRLAADYFESLPMVWELNGTANSSPWFQRMLALAARVVPVSVLEKRNRVFMNLLQHTVQRWEACPGSRKELETLLRARICDRVNVVRMMATERPADMAQLWGNTTTPAVPCNAVGTDGRPLLHDTMRPIGHRLMAELTAEQWEGLRAEWAVYQQRVDAARSTHTTAASQLQYSAAMHSMGWQHRMQLTGSCSMELSKSYCTMVESTCSLGTVMASEVLAMIELQAGLSRVLTPVQHARILLASYPYLPDIVQFCRWLCTPTVAAPQQMLGGDAPGAFFSGGQAEAEAILDGLFDDEEVDLLASLVTVDAGHLVPLRP